MSWIVFHHVSCDLNHIGLWQRKVAEGFEGNSRRMTVFEALSIKSGQALLDLGCGGGHLVRDIALAVGEAGRAGRECRSINFGAWTL